MIRTSDVPPNVERDDVERAARGLALTSGPLVIEQSSEQEKTNDKALHFVVPPQRQPTEGEYRVGLTFNPNTDKRVDSVNRRCADLLDELNKMATDRVHPGARWASMAMTNLETACMYWVKALTARPR